MSFPDEAAFNEWSQSLAYQQISKERLAGAESVVLAHSKRPPTSRQPHDHVISCAGICISNGYPFGSSVGAIFVEGTTRVP